MYSHSCVLLITKLACVSEVGATLIDNIWTSEVETNLKNIKVYTDISDHFPTIFFVWKLGIGSKMWLYKKGYSLLRDISEVRWESIYDIRCANKAFNVFEAKFQQIFQENFPSWSIRVKNKDCVSPFITSSLRQSIREKKKIGKTCIQIAIIIQREIHNIQKQTYKFTPYSKKQILQRWSEI